MTQNTWNIAFCAWTMAGLIVLCGYLFWYVRQPKITRIEWGNGEIEYFSGRVDLGQLNGLYQSQYGVKRRTVVVAPVF